MKLSEELANKIWDLLVKEAGAIESDRDSFVSYITSEKQAMGGTYEYRFCGHFGFGGKFYMDGYDNPPFRVGYYREDRTDKLDDLKEKINAQLSELWETQKK